MRLRNIAPVQWVRSVLDEARGSTPNGRTRYTIEVRFYGDEGTADTVYVNGYPTLTDDLAVAFARLGHEIAAAKNEEVNAATAADREGVTA